MPCIKNKLELVLFLLLMFMSFHAGAQNRISVKSFEEAVNHTDAVLHPITDPASGEKCAVIIVTGVEAGGFRFGFGSSYFKIEEIKTDDGRPAYFIYVAPGVRMVTISNRNSSIQTLRDYRFPISVKKATTYFMELDEINISKPKQYLEFTVSPANAYLEVNGEPWPLDANGYVAKSMPFGTYDYIAKADLYYPEPGVVTVNDASESAKVVLKLRPAFGFLTIDGGAELEGANIVVDDKFIGTGNIRQVRLGSGLHTLKISKDLYITYIDSIRIKDNTEIQLTPKLKSNAASVRIKASEMDIYLDDNKLGYDEWTGRLEPGDYVFEGRKEGHRPSKIQISVHNGNEKIEEEMPPAVPVYGALDIETVPSGARIMIDGVVKGVSPLTVNGLLIGKHSVEFYMEGCDPATQTVEVQEGINTQVKQILNSAITVRIFALRSSSLKIDGVDQLLPDYGIVSLRLNPGEHILEAEPREPTGNRKYFKKVNFVRNGDFHIRHSFRMSKRNSFYAMIGCVFGSMQNPSATIGFQFRNLCIEGEYQFAGIRPLNGDIVMRTYKDTNSFDGWKQDDISHFRPHSILCFRAGWRMIMGFNIAITPLLGYRLNFGEYHQDNYVYAHNITAAVRFIYKKNRYFGIAITPEYFQKVGASKEWNGAVSVNGKVKSWMTGFGIGLSFLFDL